VLDQVRAECAAIAAGARLVRVDEGSVAPYAASLASVPAPGWDRRLYRGDDRSTVAFVLTMSALNFGSGWFPLLRKPEGLSGYFTIATALTTRFRERGPFSAEELAIFTTEDCARLLGQDVEELMTLYADSLCELGRHLLHRYEGSFVGLVEAAGGRAARMVELLGELSFYADEPFWKRAQLTASELSLALDGRHWGAFTDLDRLTAFADNLVPHVLRLDGVLRYQPDLVARIEAGELLAPGSDEEVEVRAAAVHAVELISAATDGRHTAADVDNILWARGQEARYKSVPRHRCRTTAY
jgi:putative queuosine salvage protein